VPSFTLKHCSTCRTVSDFSLSDASITDLSITTISLPSTGNTAHKSESLIALPHSVALAEPSPLSLCLVTPLRFQVCAAGVSKRINQQYWALVLGINPHNKVLPVVWSHTTRLTWRGGSAWGGFTNPLLLSHARSHFFDYLCSKNYAKNWGGTHPVNPIAKDIDKGMEGAAGLGCQCWDHWGWRSPISIYSWLLFWAKEEPMPPVLAGVVFISLLPSYKFGKFSAALRGAGLAWRGRSSIGSRRSIGLSRSFSRNYLAKHMTVPRLKGDT